MLTLTFFFFFFNDTATTEIYTLSLHDALPILPFFFPGPGDVVPVHFQGRELAAFKVDRKFLADRKSTRLNSSHSQISYAVFCLKKKKTYYTASIGPCVYRGARRTSANYRFSDA